MISIIICLICLIVLIVAIRAHLKYSNLKLENKIIRMKTPRGNYENY
jgi:hypothetical protein